MAQTTATSLYDPNKYSSNLASNLTPAPVLASQNTGYQLGNYTPQYTPINYSLSGQQLAPANPNANTLLAGGSVSINNTPDPAGYTPYVPGAVAKPATTITQIARPPVATAAAQPQTTLSFGDGVVYNQNGQVVGQQSLAPQVAQLNTAQTMAMNNGTTVSPLSSNQEAKLQAQDDYDAAMGNLQQTRGQIDAQLSNPNKLQNAANDIYKQYQIDKAYDGYNAAEQAYQKISEQLSNVNVVGTLQRSGGGGTLDFVNGNNQLVAGQLQAQRSTAALALNAAKNTLIARTDIFDKVFDGAKSDVDNQIKLLAQKTGLDEQALVTGAGILQQIRTEANNDDRETRALIKDLVVNVPGVFDGLDQQDAELLSQGVITPKILQKIGQAATIKEQSIAQQQAQQQQSYELAMLKIAAAAAGGSGTGAGSGGDLSYRDQTILNGIINNFQKSPLLAGLDRTVVLQDTINAIKKNPNDAALQTNLAYGYIQALDTYQSAVREGELNNLNSIDSKIGDLKLSAQKISEGKIYRDGTALKIANAAQELINSIATAAKKKQEQFRSQAQVNGPRLGNAFDDYLSGYAPVAGGNGNGAAPVDLNTISPGLEF